MNLNRRVVFIGLNTSDLDKSTSFYKDLIGVPLEPGINEPSDDVWTGGRHAELSWREGAYLHFALFPARPPERPVSTATQLGFNVDDLSDVHQRLVEAAVKVLHAPRDEPWGLSARYLDPDGNIVQLTEAG